MTRSRRRLHPFGERVGDALDSLGALPEEPEATAPNGTLSLMAEFARAVAIDLEAAGITATQVRIAEGIFRDGPVA